jgi:cytoskeletal protein CcmA (bactofilin family)
MTMNITKTTLLATLIAFTALAAGCNASINEDINVADGAEHRGNEMTVNGDIRVGRDADAGSSDFKTVNGSIRVEDGATVSDCATVNGKLVFGDNTETGDLKTVNGNLRLGRDARVNGRIQLVNGSIELSSGTIVSRDVETVNGKIEMWGTEVGGDLINVNGGMLVTEGSIVKGDLIVREASDDPHSKPPRIIIGPDSEIEGELVFERPVKLYIHETARTGPISGAEAESFSGDEPG